MCNCLLPPETPGKFVRQADLESTSGGAFGPLGIVCAGLGEDELEVLAQSVEQVTRLEVDRECDNACNPQRASTRVRGVEIRDCAYQ